LRACSAVGWRWFSHPCSSAYVHSGNAGETLCWCRGHRHRVRPDAGRIPYGYWPPLDKHRHPHRLELHDGQDFLWCRIWQYSLFGTVQDHLPRPGTAHWRQRWHGGIADRHPGGDHVPVIMLILAARQDRATIMEAHGLMALGFDAICCTVYG